MPTDEPTPDEMTRDLRADLELLLTPGCRYAYTRGVAAALWRIALVRALHAEAEVLRLRAAIHAHRDQRTDLEEVP